MTMSPGIQVRPLAEAAEHQAGFCRLPATGIRAM
jgi:hypothetical protein